MKFFIGEIVPSMLVFIPILHVTEQIASLGF